MEDIKISTSQISQIVEKILQEADIPADDLAKMLTTILKEVRQKTDGSKQEPETATFTAGEASNLWTQFIGDSLSICVYTYFLTFVEDQEIRSILEEALQLSKKHISEISNLYNEANFQIPKGLTEEDVNPSAPRLFSDKFILFYTEVMLIHGLVAYSLATTSSDRKDIRNHFFESGVNATKLFNKTVDLGQSRGFYAASPRIRSLDKVEFMEKKGTISALFGDPRPLNASEINNIFFNVKKTICGEGLNLAFSQVARSEEVRDFLIKNNKLAKEHIQKLSALLEQDNLPAPPLWSNEVTESTVSPFSDKLLMYHIGFLFNTAVAYYGTGISSSLRADVITTYGKLITDVMKQGNEWLDIMIKYEWLEKQPEAIDRKGLAKIEK